MDIGRDFRSSPWFCVTAVKISLLCAILAFWTVADVLIFAALYLFGRRHAMFNVHWINLPGMTFPVLFLHDILGYEMVWLLHSRIRLILCIYSALLFSIWVTVQQSAAADSASSARTKSTSDILSTTSGVDYVAEAFLWFKSAINKVYLKVIID